MASNFKGVFIPDNIITNLDMSLSEALVFSYIWGFGEKGCFASDKYIAERLKRLSVSSIKHILNSLREKGLIYSKISNGKRTIFCSSYENDVSKMTQGGAEIGTYEVLGGAEIGTYWVPKSALRRCRNRHLGGAEIGKTPQGENRGAINNSIKNFSSNGSSNATQASQTSQTSQASPAPSTSSASPTTTATAQNFPPIASERSERLNVNGPQVSYVVEKIKRFQFKYGLRHHTQICQTIYNQLDEEVSLRNNDNDPVSRNTSISNLLDYCLSDVFDPSVLICEKPDFVLVNCLNDILVMRSRNPL